MSKKRQLKIGHRIYEPDSDFKLYDRTMPFINMMLRRMETDPEYKQAVDALGGFDVNETAKKGADAGYLKVLTWSLVDDIHDEYLMEQALENKAAFKEDYEQSLIEHFESVKALSKAMNDILPYALIGQKVELWHDLHSKRQEASDKLALAISHYAEHHGTDEMKQLVAKDGYGEAFYLVHLVVVALFYKTRKSE